MGAVACGNTRSAIASEGLWFLLIGSPHHRWRGVNMLTWNDVVALAQTGNPPPDRQVRKTDEEWRAQLSSAQYQVARQKGTERAFSSPMCNLFEPGRYACAACANELFDAGEKFESGSGWPSFTQPVKANAVAYHSDQSHGMQRIEVTCNSCEAHLGHVFPDGPEPSGLRYCINAVILQKVTKGAQLATVGGGCFWCTEAMFQSLQGVLSVTSGYSGGQVKNPGYREVCSGTTGHAEVVQIEFDPKVIDYGDLVRMHLTSHDPTTLNQQGADKGTQYRSVIFTHNEEQERLATAIIDEMQADVDGRIVTEVTPFTAFYAAESEHQDYYRNHSSARYCQLVIDPKLDKFRRAFADKLVRS